MCFSVMFLKPITISVCWKPRSTMSDKVEELALPSAVITRILKEAVPDGINISKEARSAVARAASIFVLYTTACASHVQATSQRKTLHLTDVYTALEDMLYEDMIDPIKECVETFHTEKGKKETTIVTSPSKSLSAPKPKRKRSQSTAIKETESSNSLTSSTEITVTDSILEEQESSLIDESVQ